MVAGEKPVFVDTPFGRLGFSVCYDLRFPELYRYYSQQGVELVFAPSAFTATTGEAHWEALIRARAIENQIYLIAANQGGENSPKRETWGHSMIVDAWGEVLGERQAPSPGVVIAAWDKVQQEKLRETFPVLKHRVLSI